MCLICSLGCCPPKTLHHMCLDRPRGGSSVCDAQKQQCCLFLSVTSRAFYSSGNCGPAAGQIEGNFVVCACFIMFECCACALPDSHNRTCKAKMQVFSKVPRCFLCQQASVALLLLGSRMIKHRHVVLQGCVVHTSRDLHSIVMPH